MLDREREVPRARLAQDRRERVLQCVGRRVPREGPGGSRREHETLGIHTFGHVERPYQPVLLLAPAIGVSEMEWPEADEVRHTKSRVEHA